MLNCFSILAGLASCVAIPAHQSDGRTNELHVVGYLHQGFTVISREEHRRKAIADLDLSKGKNGLPFGEPHCTFEASWSGAMYGSEWRSPICGWKIDGEDLCLRGWPPRRYMGDCTPCPYVFGRHPREALALIGKDGLLECRLSLPANGIQEPTLRGGSKKFGPWTVDLRPRPWISPSFAPRFDVTVHGNPHLMYRVGPVQGLVAYEYETTGNKPVTFELRNWKKGKLRLAITEVHVVPLTITVRGRTNGQERTTELITQDGVVLYRATWNEKDGGKRVELPEAKKYSTIRCSVLLENFLWNAAWQTWPDGKTVRAEGLKIIRSEELEFDTGLSDPEAFPYIRG